MIVQNRKMITSKDVYVTGSNGTPFKYIQLCIYFRCLLSSALPFIINIMAVFHLSGLT